MYSVLFVCTANRCRSPMAEAIFRSKLQGLSQLDDWQIGSAGTWAEDGLLPMEAVTEVMKARGIDLSYHRSHCLTAEMVDSYRLILTMDHDQKEALQVEFPGAKQRVYLLSEMAGSTADIEDPVGGSFADYRNAADRIAEAIEMGFKQIEKLSK